MRRIVEYPRKTQYSDIKISPQWHQWLRHTRKDAPTIQEQSLDVVRMRNLKVLAAEADKRWAAKKSLLDAPARPDRTILTGLGISDAGRLKGDTERGTWNPETDKHEVPAPAAVEHTARMGEEAQAEQRTPRFAEPLDDRRKDKQYTENPWEKARGGPSEDWQPAAAQISPAKR